MIVFAPGLRLSGQGWNALRIHAHPKGRSMKSRWSWMTALSLFVACTLVTLPGTGQVKAPGPPPPPTQNVLVVNGSGQPVPTAPQGTTTVTGTVNVGNTPSVNVANIPSVSVANTPSVVVTNSPTVTLAGGASVAVTSQLDGQGNPTPLAALEAIQPYEDMCTAFFSGTIHGACNFQTVPSGKRLVIQEFDAGGLIETGLRPLQVLLQPVSSPHYFPATFMGTQSGYDSYATHQDTRLYVQSTLAPSCLVYLTGPSSNGAYVCLLSGFLVDVP